MKNLSFQFPTWYQIYCLLTYAYCTVFSVTLVLMELRLCTSKLERQLNSTGENRRFDQQFFTDIVFGTVFYPLNCIFRGKILEQMKALCMLCLMD